MLSEKEKIETKPEKKEEKSKENAKTKTSKSKKKEEKYIFSKNKEDFVEIKFMEDSCGLSTLIAEELWNVKEVSFSAQKRGHLLIDRQKLIFKAKNTKKALLSAINSSKKKLDELKKKI